MTTGDRSSALTGLARLGFTRLDDADAALAELASLVDLPREALAADAATAADTDGAVDAMLRIARRDPGTVRSSLLHPRARDAAWALLGASLGFADFYLRHPEELVDLAERPDGIPSSAELRTELLDAVGDDGGFAADGSERAWVALRVRYRRM
ncbi:MAG: bifunctional glutamine-synthetase adenylyltransferase/deadenyltransferase, partial [Microbacterium sp.]|nr:bifunctional glutamine-synthetase adenylyltransferase/deadenyltransferase [Microbacterium sp.]